MSNAHDDGCQEPSAHGLRLSFGTPGATVIMPQNNARQRAARTAPFRAPPNYHLHVSISAPVDTSAPLPSPRRPRHATPRVTFIARDYCTRWRASMGGRGCLLMPRLPRPTHGAGRRWRCHVARAHVADNGRPILIPAGRRHHFRLGAAHFSAALAMLHDRLARFFSHDITMSMTSRCCNAMSRAFSTLLAPHTSAASHGKARRHTGCRLFTAC